MAGFKYEIYKAQRVCLVRFIRHSNGEPAPGFPDIDNRGCFRANTNGTGYDRGPVVSVMKGDDIYVKVLREKISNEAPLFVSSSDESVMKVVNSGKELPKDKEITLHIIGVDGIGGSVPKGARLRIHYGSEKGVVIGELSVWVFSKMNVLLTPWRITIESAPGNGIASSVNVNKVIGMVKAIWRPYGITFTDAPVQNQTLALATAGVLAWQADFDTLLSTHFTPDSINAYFVNQINHPAGGGVLGVGLSRQVVTSSAATANPIPNPGIFLNDRNQDGTVRSTDTHWLANDLAHEIGHFFGLSHVDKRNLSNPRNDTWCKRMLMHPLNTRNPQNNWRDDVGYGKNYRGALVSLKDLLDTNNAAVNHITDPEYLTARNTINSSTGPY